MKRGRDKKTKRHRDKETKRQSDKKAKRQKDKKEFDIVISGQFRTLVIFLLMSKVQFVSFMKRLKTREQIMFRTFSQSFAK